MAKGRAKEPGHLAKLALVVVAIVAAAGGGVGLAGVSGAIDLGGGSGPSAAGTCAADPSNDGCFLVDLSLSAPEPASPGQPAVPATTLPAGTASSPATTSAPVTTLPATTVPATTVPATTVPATTLPATTLVGGGCWDSCGESDLAVGATSQLTVEASWSDGSESPLNVPMGSQAPVASVFSAAVPADALTLTGVVTGSDGDDEVLVTASEPTTAPAVIEVGYQGMEAFSVPLAAVPQPTCGTTGLPACTTVEGADLGVTAELGTSPLPGVVADISQAGWAGGAYTPDVPCYPTGAGATEACGPAPDGYPPTASPGTCTTDGTGRCALAAMWDGTAEGFALPDIVTIYPPAGYLVTGVSGCTGLTGPAWGPSCGIAPGDWSQPLQLEVAVAPYPSLTVDVSGPLEPSCGPACGTGDDDPTGYGPTYDNDAVDGTVVTITPTGTTTGQPTTCEVANGLPGDNSGNSEDPGEGEVASCGMYLAPGTYDVSVPASIATPYSEVGIAQAYVTGPTEQVVSLAPGGSATAGFATAYEPTINVDVAGPLEPPLCDPTFLGSCADGESPALLGPMYDNDAVDGTVATIAPVDGTLGQVTTCEVDDGYPGASTGADGDASCAVSVPPGTYSVSLPNVVQTPWSEVGIPEAFTQAPTVQTVAVVAGDDKTVSFATNYQPTVTVEIGGPLEPGCASACPAGQEVYDNDTVNGATAVVTPIDGTAGASQECQVANGYPGDDSGSGQVASCTVEVTPGEYTVSVPASITPVPSYGWGQVQVQGDASEVITVAAGENPFANFTTTYQAMGNQGSGPGSARTADGLVTAVGSGGHGTVSVGEYGADPYGPPTFNTYSNRNDYFEVALSPDSTFGAVQVTACGLKGSSQAVEWWDTYATGDTADGQMGAWEQVKPVSAVSAGKQGCLTLNLTASTAPSTVDFAAAYGGAEGTAQTGIVFAVPEGLAGQKVSFASKPPVPAMPGGTYQLSAVATSGLAVSYSVGLASAHGACAIQGAGKVVFRAPGTCEVQAYQAGNTHWASAQASQQVAILAPPPVAVGADYSTASGKALKVSAGRGLLSRDTLNGAKIASHTSPLHGQLVLGANGAFVYTPRTTFSGTDRFTYTLKNQAGRAKATVTIRVAKPAGTEASKAKRGRR